MRPITITHPADASATVDALASATPSFTGPSQTRSFSRDHIQRMVNGTRRRPEWTWLATNSDGTPLALVAAMSPFPEFSGLLVVDMHAASDPEVAEALYRRILDDIPALELTEPLEMSFQFAARPNALTDPAVAPLVNAANRAGFDTLVVRRRYELHADAAPPALASRLTLETPTSPDDPRLREIMTATMQDTLDAHDLRSLETMSAEEVARQSLGYYLEAESLQAFSLAYAADRALVGIVIGAPWPSGGLGAVSFVGVHPDHRGRGYAAQLASLKVQELLAAGVQTIVGDTDETNVPMANAFVAAGFIQTETRIDFAPGR